MKLTVVLKTLLIAQIIAYGWAIQIMYAAAHDAVDSFAGLLALLPIGIFIVLSGVNALLLIIYFYRQYQQRSSYDYWLIGLAVLLIMLAFLYKPITDWALSGS